jgi:hypothetical protein
MMHRRFHAPTRRDWEIERHPNGINWGWGKRSGNFVCYFWFVGWDCISLGLHVCSRNVEFHIPFGFVRIGRP